MKYKLYSDSDIKVILDQIRLYPDNLNNAFVESGKKLNRKPNAIAKKYYNSLRKRDDFKAIIVGSKKGFTQNVKNTPRNKGVFPSKRKLNKPLWLIQSFLELSASEKEAVLKILTT